MASTKISAATAVVTPAGTDEFPVNQAGASKRMTLDQVKTYSAPAAASDTVAGVAEIATQAEQETGTDNVRIVAPGRQHFHISAAKCWMVTNWSGATPTLQTSYNITSITDTGLGVLTVTIATDFANANWCCVAMGCGAGAAVGDAKVSWGHTKAAGSVVIMTADLSATPVIEDPISMSMVGFGDLP